MQITEIKVGAHKVIVQTNECPGGGITVAHALELDGGTVSEWHLTCRCTGGGTVTKVCPTANAKCDCSNPKNPILTCQ
jgi:hypothetical protein